MKGIIILAILVLPAMAHTQNLTARTNSIHLDFSAAGLVESASLPRITWVYPVQEYSSSVENGIEITAEITSRSPVKSIQLVLSEDASKKEIVTRDMEVGEGVYEYKLKQKLKLPDGTIAIDIKVTNAEGAMVSDTRRVVIGENGFENVIAMDRKDYALLFATDRYDHWDDLVNPIDDAYSIARVLEEKYGFEVEIVKNPTSNEIWEKLRSYHEIQFNPQDQLLVFFAGHGHFDETFGEGYVVATNSLKHDVAKTTYVSHNRLRGVLDNIDCNHILLTMDVCFGGTFDPVLARARSLEDYEISIDDMIVRKFSKKTRKYLTSGGKEYVSDGIPGQHSPFTAKLLQSLRSLGGSDRILTMSEIKVNMENLAQVPRFGSFGTDEQLSDFIFIAR